MSFADELKKKSGNYNPETIRERVVESYIYRSVKAIKASCDDAASKGKKRIDGFVYYDNYDGYDYVTEKRTIAAWQEGNGELLTLFNTNEEKKLIDGIRKEIQQLGFCNYEIKSYYPRRIISGYKMVGVAIFRSQKRVPLYSYSDGFCIEVHVKW